MKTLFLLILASATLFGCSDSGVDAACRANLRCRADKFVLSADVFCKERIEKLAQSDMKWERSRDWELFSKYEWKDKTKGTITYFGDKAQFKTPTGAYVSEIYECDIDPDNKSAPVLDVRIKPGKLQP